MTSAVLQGTHLDFSTGGIRATVLFAAFEQRITGRAIIINLGPADAFVHGEHDVACPPLQSVMVIDAQISGTNLVVIEVTADSADIAADARAEWCDFYRSNGAVGDYPELLRSPRFKVGQVAVDLATTLRQPELPVEPREFDVFLNLWFSPAGTACGIHNEHDFLEIHTQLTGRGRMQKFRAKSAETLYEEYLLSAAVTNPATFCNANGTRFDYPWHQYFADTDCVWLAVEYHAR